MEIDVNKSCRSCLCESNGTMHSISEPAKISDNSRTIDKETFIPTMSIAEVIMTCTIVNISPDDGLPQFVCSQCFRQIQQVFQFKEKCEAADLQMRHYSLNRADPISFIKMENDENEQAFHPETVLVTKFEEESSESGDDDDDNDYAPTTKRAKNRKDSKPSAGTKVKAELSKTDMDEKTLLEQVEIVDGRYLCKFCDKTLADRQTFRLHIRLHTGTNLKRCEICGRGFAKKNHLERHLATHGQTYKCKKSCTKAFLTDADRKQHELSCKKSDDRQESNKVKVEDEPQNSQVSLLVCKKEELNEMVTENDDSFDPNDISNKCDVVKAISIIGENYQRTKIPFDDEEHRLISRAKVENNRYECPLCTKILSREELLVLHIRTAHTGKNLLRCSVCNKGFAKPYNLNRHMLIHDNFNMDEAVVKAQRPDGTFSCKFCAKIFVERQSFRVHLRMHITTDNPPANQCEICKQSFADETELSDHMPVHGDSFPCVECDETFKSFRDRKNHIESVHTKTETSNASKATANTSQSSKKSKSRVYHDDGDDEDEQIVNSAELINGRYRCKFCEKTLANRSSLKLHIRLHLKKKLKMCELCGHGYSRKSHLDRHMKTHFPKQPECKICNETFETMQEQKVHMTAEHKMESKVLARPHQCDLCSKSFTTVQRFNDHRQRHFDETKRFACDICSKVFHRYDNMRTHMRCHIPLKDRVPVAKTHLCSYCGQGFSNSSNLSSHIRTHTGEKPFKCDLCDSRFRRSCDLSCHRRTHTGERPYPCLVCGIRFSRSNKLVRHMRIHSGERPYKCTECGRAFTQSNDLTLHIRRHTGDRPFECVCGDKFITNSLLKLHRRTHGH